MEIIAYKKLNLIPIGKIRFSFTKCKGTIPVMDLTILTESDVNITPEQYKQLIKLMKKEKSDLLTDGARYYTTRGEVITQIKHDSFHGISREPENKAKIDALMKSLR